MTLQCSVVHACSRMYNKIWLTISYKLQVTSDKKICDFLVSEHLNLSVKCYTVSSKHEGCQYFICLYPIWKKKKAKTWLDCKQKGIDITFKKTYS